MRVDPERGGRNLAKPAGTTRSEPAGFLRPTGVSVHRSGGPRLPASGIDAALMRYRMAIPTEQQPIAQTSTFMVSDSSSKEDVAELVVEPKNSALFETLIETFVEASASPTATDRADGSEGIADTPPKREGRAWPLGPGFGSFAPVCGSARSLRGWSSLESSPLRPTGR